MKKILYISNIEVPYRVEFFNQLASKCDLTVIYESNSSHQRNINWTKSITRQYKAEFMNGFHVGGDNSFSLGIIKYIFGRYDLIIIGCYNSPVQMFAILLMKLLRIKYCINLDGEVFLTGNSIKEFIKKFFLKNAYHYLVAGNTVALSLEQITKKEKITIYPFTSLTENEIKQNSLIGKNSKRNGSVLVVGQYYAYKGLDIAVNAAKLLPDINWKFVGMGKRSELFIDEQRVIKCSNIEVVPFLQKQQLNELYCTCSVVVLPSRQECWGLVINEAASFGTPIVSTWGCGAAVEFLADSSLYSKYLVDSGDFDNLAHAVKQCLKEDNSEYSLYLLNKSKEYTIEKCVEKTLKVMEK